MTMKFERFGVVGAGAWGTALALAMVRAERNVTLWVREPELAQRIVQTRENADFLPEIKLPEAVAVTSDLAALANKQVLILAVPAQYMRATCKALKPLLTEPVSLVIAAKGIELVTHRLMSEVVEQELPGNPIFVLSGPSFAREVALEKPAALTLAGEVNCDALALAMASSTLRLYTTDDIIGTQIGGAVKNVLAIASGIVSGRALGDNARAALITRGLAEIVRLGVALGARAETLMGLSGLGDVVLTCAGEQSRNMSLGYALGQGKTLQDILASRKSVAEGITTAAATLGLANRHGVDMPVARAVDLIVRDNANIDAVIAGLLSRPLRSETV